MKKILLTILLISFTKIVSGQSDPTVLWIFRMDQDANENAIFRKFQGNTTGYPSSTGLLEKNDTLRYSSGKLFRTCEVLENKLNGSYKINYPSGQIYLVSIYKNNVLTDSSIIYSEKGNIESIINYLPNNKEKQTYYSNSGKIKRIDFIEIIPTDNTTFKSGYVHTNTVKSVTTDYFNTDNQKITKKEYYKLYPEEKK